MAAVDHRSPYNGSGLPHRKPLPAGGAQPSLHANDQFYVRQLQAHPHTRTASSSGLPPAGAGAVTNAAATTPSQSYKTTQQPPYSQPMPQQAFQPSARRTLSNATSSTSSTGNGSAGLVRGPTNQTFNSSIRRSTSSRSTTSTSYVALMRKQKATVWCDRAQHEDPRILAQQRAAKMRATMEVVGGTAGSRTSTSSGGGLAGGVRSKIRHHGAVKASAYTSANLSGAGVPMRLSASEVDEGESDDDSPAAAGYNGSGGRHHTRNGSSRSSLGSQQRGMSFHAGSGLGLTPMHGRYSNGSTPPSGQSHSPAGEAGQTEQPSPADAEAGAHQRRESSATEHDETPVPDMYAAQGDYFEQAGQGGGSGGSASDGEERGFGDATSLPLRRVGMQEWEQQKKPTNEELRRRGSVDDRTMTMSGVRLFVANPDADSD